MRTYKLFTLAAAIAIIALETFVFSRASTDAPDIGITGTVMSSDSPSVAGDTP